MFESSWEKRPVCTETTVCRYIARAAPVTYTCRKTGKTVKQDIGNLHRSQQNIILNEQKYFGNIILNEQIFCWNDSIFCQMVSWNETFFYMFVGFFSGFPVLSSCLSLAFLGVSQKFSKFWKQKSAWEGRSSILLSAVRGGW